MIHFKFKILFLMYVFNLELILCSVRQRSNSVSSPPSRMASNQLRLWKSSFLVHLFTRQISIFAKFFSVLSILSSWIICLPLHQYYRLSLLFKKIFVYLPVLDLSCSTQEDL